jgi:hypothetical protein
MHSTPVIMTSLVTNFNCRRTWLKSGEGIKANEFYVFHFDIDAAVVFEVARPVIGM